MAKNDRPMKLKIATYAAGTQMCCPFCKDKNNHIKRLRFRSTNNKNFDSTSIKGFDSKSSPAVRAKSWREIDYMVIEIKCERGHLWCLVLDQPEGNLTVFVDIPFNIFY